MKGFQTSQQQRLFNQNLISLLSAFPNTPHLIPKKETNRNLIFFSEILKATCVHNNNTVGYQLLWQVRVISARAAKLRRTAALGSRALETRAQAPRCNSCSSRPLSRSRTCSHGIAQASGCVSSAWTRSESWSCSPPLLVWKRNSPKDDVPVAGAPRGHTLPDLEQKRD